MADNSVTVVGNITREQVRRKLVVIEKHPHEFAIGAGPVAQADEVLTAVLKRREVVL